MTNRSSAWTFTAVIAALCVMPAFPVASANGQTGQTKASATPPKAAASITGRVTNALGSPEARRVVPVGGCVLRPDQRPADKTSSITRRSNIKRPADAGTGAAPISGIAVTVEYANTSAQDKCPLDQATTDDSGRARLKVGTPGQYVVLINGESLVAAVDKSRKGRTGTLTVSVSSDQEKPASSRVRYEPMTAVQGLRVPITVPAKTLSDSMPRYIFAGVTLDF